MSNVHVIDHPLVQHKLTLMRKKDASTNSFRRLLGELSTLWLTKSRATCRCRTSRSKPPWRP